MAPLLISVLVVFTSHLLQKSKMEKEEIKKWIRIGGLIAEGLGGKKCPSDTGKIIGSCRTHESNRSGSIPAPLVYYLNALCFFAYLRAYMSHDTGFCRHKSETLEGTIKN